MIEEEIILEGKMMGAIEREGMIGEVGEITTLTAILEAEVKRYEYLV